MAVDTLELEVCLKWSPGLKDNLIPALSWLAEVQWINDRLCPECNGIDPLAAPDECMGPDEAGHETGCRLAAMMRIFGVVPDMIKEPQETPSDGVSCRCPVRPCHENPCRSEPQSAGPVSSPT